METIKCKPLPLCFWWNNKNKEFGFKLKSLVNELVSQGCFNSKRRIQSHNLLKEKKDQSDHSFKKLSNPGYLFFTQKGTTVPTNCEPFFGSSSGQTVIQSLFSKLKSFCQT
jgi:hypothetical protein